MVAHMQHGSLSTILKPCTATPLPIPLVFSEWEGVDQIGFRNVGWEWESWSTWSTLRKPNSKLIPHMASTGEFDPRPH